jgi:opacity protein-like surface antigen
VTRANRRVLCIAALAAAALFTPFGASAQPDAPPWKFSVMPYLWLPSIDGRLNYGPPPQGGGSASVSVDASTILDNLAFAMMINGEARKGRWFVGTDLIYLDLNSGDSAVRSVDLNPGPGRINVSTSGLDAGTSTKLKGWVWTLGAGYAAIQDPRANLDVFGGFRLLDLESTTNWQLTTTITGTGPGGTTATFPASGTVEHSESVWAGIVGAKGRAKLGASDWFVNYYADIGGWSDLFTWQGALGVGYAFRWGEVLLDYRYLYYSQGGDKLIDNMSFGGVALGVNFRF